MQNEDMTSYLHLYIVEIRRKEQFLLVFWADKTFLEVLTVLSCSYSKMDPEDIVISGVAGRFPKSANLHEFKENLYSNEILLGSRWKEGNVAFFAMLTW